MAKVSIIVPVYNIENYIERCIESLINQTECDIEIILVNDGSTDSSGVLCDSYAKLDSRIRVIHKKNGGLSSARNTGVSIAASEYVQLVDGDDYLRKDAVERLVEVMMKYPSDIIQFQYQEVDDNETPVYRDSDSDIYQAATSRELFEKLYKLGGVGASACTKLFRRELLLRVPFANVQHEDEMWCTQAFQDSLTVTYIPDVLYFYVMRESSIIHSKFNYKKLDIFKIIDARTSVVKNIGMTQLVHYEYKHLFLSIISLYCEARNAGDKQALDIIRNKFLTNKRFIRNEANLSGKFFVLMHLMNLFYGSVELYRWYWKIKNKL